MTGLRYIGCMAIAMVSFISVGCQTSMPMNGVTAQQIETMIQQAIVDTDVSKEIKLLESQAVKSTEDVTAGFKASLNVKEKRKEFNVVVSEVDAEEFFISLTTDTPYNILVHPDVSGQITLTLKKVTFEEVLEAVSDVYGYHIEKSRYGYRVYPPQLVTQIYHLNYLNVSRDGRSTTSVSSGEITQVNTNSGGGDGDSTSTSTTKGASVETVSRADFWSELKSILNLIIGTTSNNDVVVNAQSGLVVVRAYPEQQRNVRQFIRESEQSLKRQVIIEAKILEIELTDGFQSGINWSQIGKHGSDHSKTSIFGLASETLTNADNINGVFGISLALNDFTGLIELLETQGEVHVLSSPRISTVNNQKAVIKVGSDEFFVTELKSNTSATSGTTGVVSPEITLTPFFSGIALDVTPQIGEDGDITLHVHPTVSEVTERSKFVDLGTTSFTLPLAFSRVRESDSIIRARDGQIVVIGGLLQNRMKDTEAKVPLLGDIPFIGGLFKQKRQSMVKSELVILLRPRVVGADGWKKSLEKSADHFGSLKSTDKRWDFF